jgi:hypothetical protein
VMSGGVFFSLLFLVRVGFLSTEEGRVEVVMH